MSEHNAPEQRTVDVDVQALDTRGRTLHGYAAVYGAVSSDLGGFTETIAPGAFAAVLDADVRALLNHDPSQVLGRTRSGTLRLADEQRGLRFEVDLPDSPLGENVREAVKRGDIDGASFRFVVGEETWDADKRTIVSVKDLQDVTVATYGAYPDASVELRTRTTNTSQETTVNPEDRQQVPETASGGLAVEDRTAATQTRARGLAEAFRTEGFPAESATVDWSEYRAAAFTGTTDNLNPLRTAGVDLGADQRYAWPVFPQVSVDAGDTAVQVLTQTARTFPTTASMIRAIDAVTSKPEVGSTLAIVTTALKQVAAIESNIPNVFLAQSAFDSVIQTDLRLALNEALDKLVLDAVASSGFQAPATDPLLISIRKAITTIQGAGYSPNVLVLTPGNAEALDTLRATTAAGEQDYVFSAGQLAPRNLFGLQVRVSKTAAAPFVADSGALGKLYASPIRLARFEQDAGATNRSTVRLEGSAVFGVERQDAAVRIAAS